MWLSYSVLRIGKGVQQKNIRGEDLGLLVFGLRFASLQADSGVGSRQLMGFGVLVFWGARGLGLRGWGVRV